ncbi:DNA topoisomerase III [Helicovermis profundi]|uniref:DNA topoisomerase 3 n=1 Tax=Helicovermis profundi TaxID=3065157 RepID=A0AAU9E1U9_9FIRM|nr:DNA topoisomerase III [Clostridia bacterium S502]
MSKRLILAEKPSVGKEIARVLNCKNKKNGYFEGNDSIVTWAYGHLVTLGDPEVYDDKYKNWVLDDLPIIPEKLKTVIIGKTARQYKIVKDLMLRKDIGEIIIATDAGREGELVARWVIEKVRTKKPIKRLWISSVTDKAIRDGFNNLQPGKKYENLFKAATARAESDWIVGINGTRALTTKHNAQLSLGRVQTPTLALISQREDQIRKFTPKKYYGIKILVDKINENFIYKSDNQRIFDEKKIDDIINTIKYKDAKVTSIIKKDKKEYSNKLYDLTSLQRDAFNKYGYSPKMTLSLMQRLYEFHKILSYPRTDSNYLTDDMVATLKDRLKTIQINPYRKFAFNIMRGTIKKSKHFVDESKVSDHHAIIPTEESILISSLSFDERRIYELVVQRFLEVLMPPYEYEETVVTLSVEGYQFLASYNNIKRIGFKVIGQSGEKQEKSFHIVKNQSIRVMNVSKTIGETKPLPYFNEATLLGAMENPSKFIKEGETELKKILTETGGLGTVATRAEIIEKLFQVKYMEKKATSIRLTKKGKQILELVPKELKSPLLSAKWERNLKLIENGKLDKKEFIDDMKEYTFSVVNQIKSEKKIYKHDNLTGKKCPNCGKDMMMIDNKKGKMLVCVDRECGYRERISMLTNARCPNCHKKLSLRGEKGSQIFTCSCGYKESMTSFEKRKNERKKQGGKNDYANYVKKQKQIEAKEKLEDNPFAKALKGLKF